MKYVRNCSYYVFPLPIYEFITILDMHVFCQLYASADEFWQSDTILFSRSAIKSSFCVESFQFTPKKKNYFILLTLLFYLSDFREVISSCWKTYAYPYVSPIDSTK